MDKALYIARDKQGSELLSMELPYEDNLTASACRIMSAANKQEDLVHCCEVWVRTSLTEMNLLATFY